MGLMALASPNQTSVMLDIGGTTTDIALVLSGKPLLSSNGAKVNSFLTHVRAFALRSVAIGGNSSVNIRNENITLGPQRNGLPMCMGGPRPTPTEAMRFLGITDLGNIVKGSKGHCQLGYGAWLYARGSSPKSDRPDDR